MEHQKHHPHEHDNVIPAFSPNKILESWHFKTFIITIIVAILGYLLFIIWGGWKEVLYATVKIGPIGIAIALLLSLLNYLFRFFRWQIYLDALGHHVPWLPSLRIYIAGFTLTTTPGKAGEALRSIFLKEHHVPYRTSLGAFFSERASDLVAVVALSAISLWNYDKAKPIIISVSIVLLAVYIIVQNKKWLHGIEKFAKRKLPEKFSHIIEFIIEMVLAFRKCFEWKILIYGLALGMLAWAFEGLALYYFLDLLGAKIDVTTAIFVYSFSLLIGAISFLPGGLGGAEVTMIQLLHLYGVPFHINIAVTIMIRLTTLWFSVVLGMLALPVKLTKISS